MQGFFPPSCSSHRTRLALSSRLPLPLPLPPGTCPYPLCAMQQPPPMMMMGHPPAPLPAVTSVIPPNQTIYINNLNERIKKDELKRQLYNLFSCYGTVLDVVAGRSVRQRGQAFVVFSEVTSATEAMRHMNGMPFFGQPMRIAFAKTKSFVVAQQDGSYAELRHQRDEEQKRRREEGDTPQAKRAKSESSGRSVSAPSAALTAEDRNLLPYKILFVQNIPEGVSQDELEKLFKPYHGFVEVRVVPSRPDIAFVEYENEMFSTSAMEKLQNFAITPSHMIKITYSKQ
ncbi:hypothetical protein H696_04430 [Fonticula alba]|uniref:RRM domain-containing protein n=1 Tax=Fonticula alba TaxID=691883 RepID=A0A058Z446_FONAL|nr:hypothetical protein H696_04430 [Fonticula alba]KCV69010.1 hypothetical protein H696_04430 [Fonticula alba]|eukprot:XP_009496581.1 hypothetical protein H696_04430 [Fonticula alba]